MVHIHRPKYNKQEILQEPKKSKKQFFGVRNLCQDDIGPNVYASSEDIGDAFVYRALAYRSRLYNPYNDLKVRDFEWKVITKSVFDNYVQFLDTQREAFLNEAEREYANG